MTPVMTDKQTRTRRGINTWAVAGLALLVIAVILITIGLFHTQSPPQPAAESGSQSTATETGDDSAGQESQTPSSSQDAPSAEAEPPTKGMAAATPTRLTIPAIDVDTSIMELGLTAGDELEVPPLGKDAPAGWYQRSPTPGEIGPSLIVGHVDSAHDGPAVFYELGGLHPGDTINATRDDGSTATFSVDDVTDYGKDNFPEYTVYGNTEGPEIRLITCGGDFDQQTGHYEDNIVVTGHLTDQS